jgi:hypothetical protein
MLDARTYDIEFPDVHSEEYTANVIANYMYAQCGEEGNQFNLIESIVDHNTGGNFIEHPNMYINHGSNNQARMTDKG